MIKVTVTIWPLGDRGSKRVIGEMLIINDGTGSPEHGNYDIIVEKNALKNHIRVEDFTRAHGFWALIWQALDNFKGELFHTW